MTPILSDSEPERAFFPEISGMRWCSWPIARPGSDGESRLASARDYVRLHASLSFERRLLGPPFHTLLIVAILLHAIFLATWSIWANRADDTVPFKTIELKLGNNDDPFRLDSGIGGEDAGAAEEAGQLASDALDQSLRVIHTVHARAPQPQPVIRNSTAPAAASGGERAESASESETGGNLTIQQRIAALRARQMAEAGSLEGNGRSGGMAGKGSLNGNSRENRALLSARYEQQLSAWLERYKIYPLAAKQEGVTGQVSVRVQINRLGRVQNKWIERSSGSDVLDGAALEQVGRSSPMPAAPADYPGGHVLEFRFLIDFDLSER